MEIRDERSSPKRTRSQAQESALAKRRARDRERKTADEVSRRPFVRGSAPPAAAKAIVEQLKHREGGSGGKMAHLIRAERIDTDGTFRTYLHALFAHGEPTRDDIVAAQIKSGYHPAGYGGPFDIVIEKFGDTHRATWRCAGSCE